MAPRRPTPPTPVRPELSPQEIRKCITKLERRIEDLKRFDPSKVTQRFNIPEVLTLEAAIDEALSAAFGHGTVEYDRYSAAKKLDQGPLHLSTTFGRGRDTSAQEGRQYLTEGKERSNSLLEAAIRSLREELEDMGEEVADTAPASDRRVRLDHNSASYTGLVDALDRLTAALEKLNDYPDDDLKDQQVSEIKAGRELLKPLYVRVQAIWSVIAAPLRWIATQFATKEIGHLADAAWKFFVSLFGN